MARTDTHLILTDVFKNDVRLLVSYSIPIAFPLCTELVGMQAVTLNNKQTNNGHQKAQWEIKVVKLHWETFVFTGPYLMQLKNHSNSSPFCLF